MKRNADELRKEVDKLVDRGRDLRHEADRLVMQLSELEADQRQRVRRRPRHDDRNIPPRD